MTLYDNLKKHKIKLKQVDVLNLQIITKNRDSLFLFYDKQKHSILDFKEMLSNVDIKNVDILEGVIFMLDKSWYEPVTIGYDDDIEWLSYESLTRDDVIKLNNHVA